MDLIVRGVRIEFPGLGRSMSGSETPTLEEKTQLMFWIISQMRAREHESLYSGYVNKGFVKMVEEMTKEVANTGFWRRLESVT